ncbi:hypothetical protein GCM10010363_61220 [Streptomyces omiyaensis]|uniref:hypothetical protein n=1 Tax=Streptomyces omiyaensis TaxID=68247 RepID=UPI00167839DB|nr:hypothetical protein [Streptomyces omiyaensis]GGY71583.1 hypothetical protein GCM10010363_61220 [Streptomyces omiyaensis]
MTAQPEHPTPATLPPMRTIGEIRAALRVFGFPGDLDAFERELAAARLDDDLDPVREIAQAYRRRVQLRTDPAAMAELSRPAADVQDELRRKIAEAAAQ